jgi:chromosome segregation ATPase
MAAGIEETIDVVPFPNASDPSPPVLQAVVAPARTTDGRWRRRGLIGGAVVMALALITAGVMRDVGTRDRLAKTRHALEATRVDLKSTKALLASAQSELSSTQSQLTSRTGERDQLKKDLDAKIAELSGVRGTLNQSENRVNIQAGQIETLKSCLNGVTNALVYAANSDYVSAVASLESVKVSCDNASKLF